MVSKLDEETFTREFDSHWVPHSLGLVPRFSKKLSKVLYKFDITLQLTYSAKNLENGNFSSYSLLTSARNMYINCQAEKMKNILTNVKLMISLYGSPSACEQHFSKMKYVVHSISFQTIFVQAFKIGVDSWKFSISSGRDSVRKGQHSSNRSVAFLPGQYTSPQFHPCHRLFDQDGHQHTSSASLQSRPCSL